MDTMNENELDNVQPVEAHSESVCRETNAAPEEPVSRKPARRPILMRTAAAALALAVTAGCCGASYSAGGRKWHAAYAESQESLNQMRRAAVVQGAAIQAASTGSIDLAQTLTPRQVYEQNSACVVAVSGTVTSTVYGQTSRGTVGGSGFVISSDGYIVTNCHVVEDASDLKVTLSDKSEHEAKRIGYDSANDVAVLKIEATNLPYAVLGNSNDLYIGDMVVAIGNPLGALSPVLTVGYVSGKDREITTDNTVINMIQTDAAINSGSSGGPLFNMYGEVVGITTAKYSGTSSSGVSIEGVSFAIPINDVMNIVTDLRDLGYVTGAYLGITVQDSDSAAAAYYGFPTGAYVVSVVEGYAAEKAGLQPKDIIIALGDTEVTGVNSLTRTLRSYKAGDKTTLTVIRAGERLVLDIELSEKPKDLNAAAAQVPEQNDRKQPSSGDYDEWREFFFGGNK